MEPVSQSAVSRGAVRVQGIDRLRGLVIALMALDHVRDYFSNVPFDPTDLTQTTPALFFTRWVTHFCAPIFVFLAGCSARLLGERTPRPALQRFLLSRGLWLVALEFSVVMFAWTFNFRYPLGLVMQVIWAIGMSMCVLAALVALPLPAIAGIALLLIAGHNLLDGIVPESWGAAAPLWNILHVPGKIATGTVLYPLIPWIGVMAAGYVFGAVFQLETTRRRRWTAALGLGMLTAFVLLRLIDGYGEPQPWSPLERRWFTLLSFLNVTKYPPSLAYVLMTLGPGLLLLLVLERDSRWWLRALQTLGRVPLFAYVVHIALAHLLAGLTALALGFGGAVLGNIFVFYPESWGFGLGGVYLAWAAVLLMLYPACVWFAGVKQTRRTWWLSYL